MKRCVLTASMALCVIPALAQPGAVIPHEFSVRLVENETIADIAESYGAEVVAAYPSRRFYLLRVTQFEDDDEVEQSLEGDDRLELSDRNRVNAVAGGHTQSFFVQSVPSSFFDQPAWPAIGLPSSNPPCQSARVTVAVLDTGVFPHPLFAGVVRGDGASFVDELPPTSDDPAGLDSNGNGVFDELAGHGTFVAGLISHMAPCAKILPVRVLDSDGQGTSFTVAAGIYYALDHRASVINLSLASPVDTLTLRDAVDAANTAGVAVVCAAGNSGDNTPQYPAAIPGCISVAAIDSGDQLAPWSSFGTSVRFSAPGVGVVSTLPPNGFASASGTSVSAALVSGAIARRASDTPKYPGMFQVPGLWQGSRTIDAANPALNGQIGRALVVGRSSVPPVAAKAVR